MKIIYFILLILIYIDPLVVKANTQIMPPSFYSCSNDNIGNCWCFQHLSNYFPEKIEVGASCPSGINTQLKINSLTMSDNKEPSRAIAYYGDYPGRDLFSAYSTINLYHGKSHNWNKAPVMAWDCRGKDCDLIVKN